MIFEKKSKIDLKSLKAFDPEIEICCNTIKSIKTIYQKIEICCNFEIH